MVTTFYLILIGLFVVNSALGDISPSSCVDPAGYESCISSVTSGVSSACTSCFAGSCTGIDNCTASTTDYNCASTCVCVAYQGWINCAATHCWNQGYSCEYQALVNSALENCPLAGLGGNFIDYPPYWPPPANATAGCSCDIGVAYQLLRIYDSTPAELQVCGPACECCYSSAIYSIFYLVCPGVNITDVPNWSTEKAYANASLALSTCTGTLAPTSCAQSYNVTTYSDPSFSFYGYNQAPVGSGSIFDVGTLTAPTASVITWTLVAGTTTAATAVSVSALAVSASASSPATSTKASSVQAVSGSSVPTAVSVGTAGHVPSTSSSQTSITSTKSEARRRSDGGIGAATLCVVTFFLFAQIL